MAESGTPWLATAGTGDALGGVLGALVATHAAEIAADGEVASVEATGDLTMHGVTQSVTVDLQAALSGDGVQVSGSIPVTFSDYGVQAPDLGFVSVEDSGTVEFLVAATPAS